MMHNHYVHYDRDVLIMEAGCHNSGQLHLAFLQLEWFHLVSSRCGHVAVETAPPHPASW